MAKLIVNAFVTLDGVMQAPGGPDEDPSGGFVHGGWQAPFDDDDMGRIITEGFEDADGYLLGRKTYDIFSNFWPKVTDPENPIANKLNTLPKYVVSRSLEKVEWNNSSLLKGETATAIKKLKDGPGRTIQTWGSTEILQIILENNLADEFRIFVFPVILGSGKKLFGSGISPLALKQEETIVSKGGGVFLRLKPNGKPEYGTMGA